MNDAESDPVARDHDRPCLAAIAATLADGEGDGRPGPTFNLQRDLEAAGIARLVAIDDAAVDARHLRLRRLGVARSNQQESEDELHHSTLCQLRRVRKARHNGVARCAESGVADRDMEKTAVTAGRTHPRPLSGMAGRGGSPAPSSGSGPA